MVPSRLPSTRIDSLAGRQGPREPSTTTPASTRLGNTCTFPAARGHNSHFVTARPGAANKAAWGFRLLGKR
ncbi:hypothetical protein E2C01_089632 [Portunus trituberculatus]|uniref:Uncharacterized protein n=1 Tax=Portunus trituberculatus TaxID=210409 RepID=A0A5B7J9B5_PORTR|nr:hypothetical protein [Portunus trituberculatus]